MVNNRLNNPLHKRLNKGKSSKNELETIFLYLQKHIATVSMVSAATGISQKNICRYKRDLEKAGQLWEIEKKPCKCTGFKGWYLTTNPEKAPDRSQQNGVTR